MRATEQELCRPLLVLVCQGTVLYPTAQCGRLTIIPQAFKVRFKDRATLKEGLAWQLLHVVDRGSYQELSPRG